jgi:hypothetical protein
VKSEMADLDPHGLRELQATCSTTPPLP